MPLLVGGFKTWCGMKRDMFYFCPETKFANSVICKQRNGKSNDAEPIFLVIEKERDDENFLADVVETFY